MFIVIIAEHDFLEEAELAYVGPFDKLNQAKGYFDQHKDRHGASAFVQEIVELTSPN